MFDEGLACQPLPARTQSGADGQFPPAALAALQNERGHVDAGNQKDEADGREHGG